MPSRLLIVPTSAAIALAATLVAGRVAAPDQSRATHDTSPDAVLRVARNVPDAIILTDGVRKWRASTQRLGVDSDTHTFRSALASSYLERLAPVVAYPGVNATVLRAPDGTVTITKSQMARKLDVPGTLAKLQEFLQNPTEDAIVHVAIAKTKPAVATEDLEGINARLSTFTTHYNTGDRDRTYNLRMVAKKLDGAVIPPGATFSFNERVGPRDEEGGFRMAKVYVNGKISEGIGGGTCQVSGTLYNAALLAGLTPISRTHHSMTVAYLPPGRDATVDYGNIDLKLRNDADTPAYIRAVARGGRLTVSIYGGAQPDRRIRLFTETRKVGDKLRAKAYRIVERDGCIERKELLSTDIYRPKPPETKPARRRTVRRATVAARVTPQPKHRDEEETAWRAAASQRQASQ